MLEDNRAELEAESLLKILLVLAVIWIVVEIVGEVVEATVEVVDFLGPLVGLVVVGLIVLWLLDRI